MATTYSTLEEREAKARVRALSEGVRVSLISNDGDEVRYAAMSTSHPGRAYTVVIRDPNTNTDECDCPSGSHGLPCKHKAAAWMMFGSQIDLADIKRERLNAAVSQAQRDKLERELAEIGL